MATNVNNEPKIKRAKATLFTICDLKIKPAISMSNARMGVIIGK